MSDTNLTQLIVNHLTRDELHNADFTDHGNELFVQSDHAGVSVGGVGVDALDTTNITNCITEIPQDIIFDLTGGTLKLKTGSKIRKPNGAGSFTDVTMAVDVQLNQNWPSANPVLLFYVPTLGMLNICAITDCSSGSTDPISGRFHFWYDTANNLVKIVDSDGTVRTATATLPLAILTMVGDSTSNVASIKQVFNGFGYIGSTAFALPGVTLVKPNGRNADGTLKNTVSTTTSVLTTTDISSITGGLWYTLDTNGIARVNFGTYTFDEEKNYFYNTSGVAYSFVVLDYNSYRTNGVVTSFNPKFAFHAVDYNDTDFIGHQAMPSNRYIDLTLGTSPFNVTAPADGYLVFAKNASTAGYEIRLKNQSNSLEVHDAAGKNNQDLAVTIPCSKGDVIRVYFSADGVTSSFRFVYANGAK